MNRETQVKNLLCKKFDTKRVKPIINHFLTCTQKFEQSDWENSLIKAGKFIEATIKLTWIYSGNLLPRPKIFKASVYADKIIRIDRNILPEDEIRVQIPRACIFVYDITSNRGARHDPEELDPNEMDATVTVSICSWILAELIRFSTKGVVDVNEAKEIVDSLIERQYPIFEEIDGRIYVDSKKYKSALECALLILYRLYPKRVDKETLAGFLTHHNFRRNAHHLERLRPYIDINTNGNILLRLDGRRKVEQIIKRKN